MIDFDKNISHDAKMQRVNDNAYNKKIRQAAEHNTNINYDFADRDISSNLSSTNAMLGRIIKEEDKDEKPKPADIKKYKFDFESNQYNNNDNELTK